MNKPPEDLAHLPHVRKWLEVSSEVPGRVHRLMEEGSAEEREWLTEQVNVLVQMKNLLTYPYIRDRYEAGSLSIYGWHYIIETGEVFTFNDDKEVFELIS